MKAKLFAHIPGSPTKGEDRIKITSRFGPDDVYVSRLVKASGRWGKKRWLIKRSTIREDHGLIQDPNESHGPHCAQRHHSAAECDCFKSVQSVE